MDYITILKIILVLAFPIGITRTYRWIKNLDGVKQKRFATKMSVFAYTVLAISIVITVFVPVAGMTSVIPLLVLFIVISFYTVIMIKKMNTGD